MSKLETRTHTNDALEVRAAGDGGPSTLVGYAAVFGSYSRDLGGFVEVVRPGAFGKTITEADVRALYNHDPAKLLGRSAAGTLRLAEDEHGLRYEVDLPATAEGRDVAELVSRGDVTGSSFKFRAIGQEWARTESGYPERSLTEVALIDVGPVTFPAYEATDGQVALRALALEHDLDPNDVLEAAERGELSNLLTDDEHAKQAAVDVEANAETPPAPRATARYRYLR